MDKEPIDNLGSRHRDLNTRVNDAALNKINFNTVKDESETRELDKLYKIDLASKYKEVGYILDILKSGDSFYTSRALNKCEWLFNDEYSHIMNPDYLQNNVFPFTSMKMKRKIVKTAAIYVKKPERAVYFYHYCMQENIRNTPFTFFLYTTDDFKLDQLQNNKDPSFKKLQNKDFLYFRLLVGKSFILLDALLNFISINCKITEIARKFKFLFYKESEEKYLDIAEKYVSTCFGFQTNKFDPKLSDKIMKKYKHRVLAKPEFYVNTVNTNVFVRNSTVDEARIYAKTLLPETAEEFWSRNHYSIFGSVFKIIPQDQTYAFFKNFFAEFYPGAEYEMHYGFYKQEYYKFMTFKQREEWALRHLKSEKQMLGVGRDFLWYQFINFELAFDKIKRLVTITKEADIRNEMVQTLVLSARSNCELETLFNYYIKRHMNELRKYIEIFLKLVWDHHNVFEFDNNCWTSYHTIVLHMELLNMSDGKQESNKNYKQIAILYNILHGKEMSEGLTEYLLDHFRVAVVPNYLNKITAESKHQLLHEYFYTFYMNNIYKYKYEKMETDKFRHDVEPRCKSYFENVSKSMQLFNEDGTTYINNKPDPNPRKKTRIIWSHHINARSLIRDLKKDKKLVIKNLPRAQSEFGCSTRKINTFLCKIKVYFPDDVTTVYLDMFQKIILNNNLVNDNVTRMYEHVLNAVKNGVHAIFQLADEDSKIDFMMKYMPVGMKMDKKTLDVQHIRIQKAICRYSCTSRPPVPFSNVVMYMKGDYIKYCLRIFDTYGANLPLPMCQQFVHLVIDNRVSVQKHAIRLAFQCFNPDDLKRVILDIWKNTKNVSLRGVIYKAFFNKVVVTKDKQFFDVLKTLTLDIHQDDEKVVFDLAISDSNLSDDFLEDYLEDVWEAINKFKNKEPNITLKQNVIKHIRNHITIMKEEFIMKIVSDHLRTMILENNLHLTYSKDPMSILYKEKWLLTVHYIVHFHCSLWAKAKEKTVKKYVQLAVYIVKKTIERWDEIAYSKYIYQDCCWEFITNLKKTSLQEEYGDFEECLPIFETILKTVDTDLQIYFNYLLTWELRLIIITARVFENHRTKLEDDSQLEVVTECINEFSAEVGKFVTQSVETNRYFKSFSWKVQKRITHYIEELLNTFNAMTYLNSVLVSFAAGLVKFESSETYILAILLLPTNCRECSSAAYKCLINKFQDYPDREVLFYLYKTLQKYCNRKLPVPRGSEQCHVN